jgi:CheY-like chemotaxis protein
LSILIVEDTSVAAKLLELHIKSLGYETVRAASGEAAIAALETHADIEVVITDILMPGMDGFALIRTIKERPEWRSLPIVVATALSDVPNAKQITQLGVQHYLLKPVDKAQLVRTIRSALAERDVRVLSKREVIQRLDLDPAMYATLAASFVELAEESLRLLGEPREDGRIPADLALAGLSEAATMFGVERLQVVTRKLLEQQASSAASPSAVTAELDRLANALHTVMGCLRKEMDGAQDGDPASAAAAPPASDELPGTEATSAEE